MSKFYVETGDLGKVISAKTPVDAAKKSMIAVVNNHFKDVDVINHYIFVNERGFLRKKTIDKQKIRKSMILIENPSMEHDFHHKKTYAINTLKLLNHIGFTVEE